MAAAWVKSLQCKSRAFDDVVHPSPKQPLISPGVAAGVGNIGSCRNSFQGLKDVIPVKSQPNRPSTTKSKQVSPHPKSKHKPKPNLPPPPSQKPVKRRSHTTPHPQLLRRHGHHSSDPSTPPQQSIFKQTVTTTTTTTASIRPIIDPFFPSLSELQNGHQSRNVVEIIFQTRWGNNKPFPGQVEMVFKIHNLQKTITRFEDYRETVKTRAAEESGADHAAEADGGRSNSNSKREDESLVRCVADGNEMMRFHCLGPTTDVIDTGASGICAINGGKVIGSCGYNDCKSAGGMSICTFDGSGTAHENAGGGKGRRAMLVCRVIAGRVKRRRVIGTSSTATTVTAGGFESVAGEKGELLVFDSRAVLPCFLVIYRL